MSGKQYDLCTVRIQLFVLERIYYSCLKHIQEDDYQ